MCDKKSTDQKRFRTAALFALARALSVVAWAIIGNPYAKPSAPLWRARRSVGWPIYRASSRLETMAERRR